jgi:hypothetical protein
VNCSGGLYNCLITAGDVVSCKTHRLVGFRKQNGVFGSKVVFPCLPGPGAALVRLETPIPYSTDSCDAFRTTNSGPPVRAATFTIAATPITTRERRWTPSRV